MRRASQSAQLVVEFDPLGSSPPLHTTQTTFHGRAGFPPPHPLSVVAVKPEAKWYLERLCELPLLAPLGSTKSVCVCVCVNHSYNLWQYFSAPRNVRCNLCPISLDWRGCFLAATSAATADADGVAAAAAPHGIGVAWITHEVKVSPSPHQNFPESSSWILSGRGSESECVKIENAHVQSNPARRVSH